MPIHHAAGLLMCNKVQNEILFFLVHPGGPFFKNKDAGFWSIPKGLPEGTEDMIATAQREFREETGIIPQPPFHALGTIQQKGGKTVHAWAFCGEWDPAAGISCNVFPLEWPPRSGKIQHFPEVDKAAWMDYTKATQYIIPEQIPLLEKARMVLTEK